MAKDLAKEAALNVLRNAVEAFPGSIAALARRAGVSPSTISRPLNDGGYAYVPKQATLEKIAVAAGISPSLPYQATISPPPLHISQVPLMGMIRAGIWEENPDEALLEEYIELPIVQSERVLSGFVIGQNAGGFGFLDGTVVVVDEKRRFRDGDFVVIRRYRDDLVETSLRLVEQNREGVKLWVPPKSESRDAEFINGNPEDDFAYMGLVVATFWQRT